MEKGNPGAGFILMLIVVLLGTFFILDREPDEYEFRESSQCDDLLRKELERGVPPMFIVKTVKRNLGTRTMEQCFYENKQGIISEFFILEDGTIMRADREKLYQ